MDRSGAGNEWDYIHLANNSTLGKERLNQQTGNKQDVKYEEQGSVDNDNEVKTELATTPNYDSIKDGYSEQYIVEISRISNQNSSIKSEINSPASSPQQTQLLCGADDNGNDGNSNIVRSDVITHDDDTRELPSGSSEPNPTAGLKGRLMMKATGTPLVCRVCEDLASGFHYGVSTCEGCKAFFKRSLKGKDVIFRCPANNSCTIDKSSRKCCQACRLKKCNEVGMSAEYMRSKAKPKPEKKPGKRGRPCSEKKMKLDSQQEMIAGRASSSDTKSSTESSSESSDDAGTSVLMTKLTDLFRVYFLNQLPEPMDTSSATGTATTDTKACFRRTIGQQVMNIIDWAKQLPMFTQMPITDQGLMLQAGWIDVLILNWVYLSGGNLIQPNRVTISRSF